MLSLNNKILQWLENQALDNKDFSSPIPLKVIKWKQQSKLNLEACEAANEGPA